MSWPSSQPRPLLELMRATADLFCKARLRFTQTMFAADLLVGAFGMGRLLRGLPNPSRNEFDYAVLDFQFVKDIGEPA
jgi:hypothetical protein